jgi:hypothetical protein
MRRLAPLLVGAAAFLLTTAPAHALQPIEPLGSQLRLTQQGVDGSSDEDVALPDVAYDGKRDEFLAVWENDLASDREIFGRRLAADGTPIGAAFQITGRNDIAGLDSRDPAVAYDPERDRYAVAYTRRTVGDGLEVFLQLVSATGSLLKPDGTAGAQPVAMSHVGPAGDPGAGVIGGPALAYSADANGDAAPGDRWVVAYSGDPNADDSFQVMASAIRAADGAPVASDHVATDVTALPAFAPTIAPVPHSDDVAIAWQGTAGPSDVEVFARRMSGALVPTGLQRQITASASGFVGSAAADLVADDEHDQLLVAYATSESAAEGTEIHVQRLAPDLARIGANDQRVSSAGPEGSGSAFAVTAPAVSYLARLDRFLVAWIGNDAGRPGLADGEREVTGTVLDPAGVEGSPQDFTISRMGVDGQLLAVPKAVAIAADERTGRWLPVWSADDARPPLADDEFELWGRQVGALPAPVTVPSAPAPAPAAGTGAAAGPHLELQVTRATIARFFAVFAGFTRVTQLRVKHVVPGMRIELRCRGRGCPRPLRGKAHRVAVRTAGAVKLTKLFKRARLRPRARIELRVFEPGTIARVDRYVIRDRRPPRQVSRCLPPGASKPGACPR